MPTPSDSHKTAIVTGAAGTLGSAIVKMLVRNGFEVAIVDTETDRGNALKEQIRSNGGIGKFFEMDVRDQSGWLNLKNQLQSDWRRLDVLVNAAGVTLVGDFCTADIERQIDVLDINLLGAIRGCHVMCPWLAEHPSQSYLINISSCAAFLSMPWSAAYNAAKAGLMSLSETLAAEFVDSNIHVCTVCPGFFDSNLFTATGQPTDEVLARVVGRLVQRSPLTAEIVAQQIWRGMQRRQPYVLVPRRVQWMWRLKRLFPARSVRQLAESGRRLRAKYSKTRP